MVFTPMMKNDIRVSSLEIAEMTGKRHDHVLRDIEKQFNALEIDPLSFGEISKDSYGRDRKTYSLDKINALVLATGYSVILRDGIIRRWAELEQAFDDLKYRKDDKKKQLHAMELLQHLLPEEERKEKLNYIKINTVVNKATSNYFGFPKMLKKIEMSNEMLEVRDKVQDHYLKLFEVIEDNSEVKAILYKKYQQRVLEEK